MRQMDALTDIFESKKTSHLKYLSVKAWSSVSNKNPAGTCCWTIMRDKMGVGVVHSTEFERLVLFLSPGLG